MNIIDDYNACELVRTALSTLATDGENQKTPALSKLLTHLCGVLDELQPKAIPIQGLPGFILTITIDPWLEAPMDRAFGRRAAATGWMYQNEPAEDPGFDLDLSDDEAEHPDE